MCKKLYYGDEYDPLWFKRPFFFNKNNLKGLHLYKRILKYLYHDTYDSSQKRSKYSSGKTLEEYLQEMLKYRPFKLVLKHGKGV